MPPQQNQQKFELFPEDGDPGRAEERPLPSRSSEAGRAAARRFLDELYSATQTPEHLADKALPPKLPKNKKVVLDTVQSELAKIERLNRSLDDRYASHFSLTTSLNRGLVSFQANKSRAVYRWYKFKEAFSAGLVEFFLERLFIKEGLVLDPFAGSGTAVFASSGYGLDAEGIELLPIGQRIIKVKQIIDFGLSAADLDVLRNWSDSAPWRNVQQAVSLPVLRITSGAYPEENRETNWAVSHQGPGRERSHP